jgi:toxin ParE1/3/4
MTGRYVILPAADADIDGLALYYAEQAGIETATRFLLDVRRTCEMLADHPRMGWPCWLRNPRLAAIRVFPLSEFERILVFHRPARGQLEIVRLVHGSRDLDALFD